MISLQKPYRFASVMEKAAFIDPSKFEKLFNTRYLGTFAHSKISTSAIELGFSETPDRSRGHKPYVGVYYDASARTYMVTGFEPEEIEAEAWHNGVVNLQTNEIIVSLSRHDYVTNGGDMVDGGKDYFRYAVSPETSKTCRVNFLTGEVQIQ
jgi:hypothetical protein